MNIFLLIGIGCVVATIMAKVVNLHFLTELDKSKAKVVLAIGIVSVLFCGIMVLNSLNSLLDAVNSTTFLMDNQIETLVERRNNGAIGIAVGMFFISIGLFHIRK